LPDIPAEQSKMMVMQIPDQHLGCCLSALCHKELLKRPEQGDGLARARPPAPSAKSPAITVSPSFVTRLRRLDRFRLPRSSDRIGAAARIW
jgi:hypothetical protein